MAVSRDKLIKNAEKYIKSGRLENAIQEYLTLLKENPKDWQIRNQVGDLYSRIGKVREAEHHWTEMAEFYAQDGFNLKAIAIYTKVRRIDPQNTVILSKLAELRSKQGLINEARAEYIELAELYQKQNKITEALDAYRRLTDLDRDNVKIRVKLAELYAKEKMIPEAVEEFSRVADDMRHAGQNDECLQMLGRALDLDRTNASALLALAKTRMEFGQREAAITLLSDAVRANPDDASLLKFLGDTFQKEGEFKRAEECFKRLIQVDPAETQNLLSLGQAYIKRNQLDKAYELFEPVANVLVKQKEAEKAIALMRSILNVAPHHVPTLRKLVDIYNAFKQRSSVIAALTTLSEVLHARGERQEALAVMQQVIELDPENFQHRERLTRIKGDVEPAALSEEESPAPVETGRGRTATPPPAGPSARAPAPPAPVVSMDDDTATAHVLECLTEADVFMRYKLYDKAQEQLANALKLEPRNLRAHILLREIHEEKGWTREAVQECIILSEIHQERGDLDIAREILEDATKLDPNAPGLAERIRAFESGVIELVPEALVEPPAAPPTRPPRRAAPPVEEEEEFEIDLGALEEQPEVEQPPEMPEIELVDIPEEVAPAFTGRVAEAFPRVIPPPVPDELELPETPSVIPEEEAQIPGIGLPEKGEEIEVPEIDLDFATYEEKEPVRQPTPAPPPPQPPAPQPVPPRPTTRVIGIPSLESLLERPTKPVAKPPAPPEVKRPVVAPPAQPEVKQPALKAPATPEVKKPSAQPPAPPEQEKPVVEPRVRPEPKRPAHVPPIPMPVLDEDEIPELRDLRDTVASLDIHFDAPGRPTPPVQPKSPPHAAAPVAKIGPPKEAPRLPKVAPPTPPKAEVRPAEHPRVMPPTPPKPIPPHRPMTLDEVLIEDMPELEAIVRRVSKTPPRAPAPPAPPSEDELAVDLITSLDEIEFVEEPPSAAPAAAAPSLAPFQPTELPAPGLAEAFLVGEEAQPPPPPTEEELALNLDAKGEITAVTPPAPPEPALEAPPMGARDEFFDLSSELEAELLKAEVVRSADRDEEVVTDESQAYQEKSLEELFTEFKKGIDKQLGTEDYDTRYNLGIAYKEMGLIDEAIGEFQTASRDPARFVECCSLLGMCFMEKGMTRQAISWLKKGTEAPGHREEEVQGLRYDLGIAYQSIGEYDQALEAFKEVFGFSANYRSVGDRIKEVKELMARSKGK